MNRRWRDNDLESKILKRLLIAHRTISYPPFNRGAAKALNTFQNANIQNSLKKLNYDLGQNVPFPIVQKAIIEMYREGKFTGNIPKQELKKYISAALCSFFSQYGIPENENRKSTSPLVNSIQKCINMTYYWGSGKCNHYAPYMMQVLLEEGIYPVDLVFLPYESAVGPGHMVVVVGLSSQDKIEKLCESNAIIVDLWHMRTYPASDLLNYKVSGLHKYKGNPPVSNIRIDETNFDQNQFYIPQDIPEKESRKELIESMTDTIIDVIDYQDVDHIETVSVSTIHLKRDHKREEKILENQEKVLQLMRNRSKNNFWFTGNSQDTFAINDEYSICRPGSGN